MVNTTNPSFSNKQINEQTTMKTDREAAVQNYHDLIIHFPIHTESFRERINGFKDGWDAAYKHKEESRWIPVSELPIGSGFCYVVNEYDHVHEVWYNSKNQDWYDKACSYKKYEYNVKLWQYKIEPTYSPTNK